MKIAERVRSSLAMFVLFAVSVSPAAAAQADLDAPVERVKKAVVSSLEEADYKVSQPRRSGGDITARRLRVVKYTGEEAGEAAEELQRIAKVGAGWEADVKSLSEYYVNVRVAIRPVEGDRTRIAVHAQITGARRTRGRRGAPMPVPIESNGVLEQELLAAIRQHLAGAGGSSRQLAPGRDRAARS